MQVVIPTYDGYNFLVPPCVHCLRKYWPEQPMNILVVNGGGKEIQLEKRVDTQVVYLGEDRQYGSNLIAALDKFVKDEIFLLWLDDYMLHDVGRSVMAKAKALITEPNIDCVRLSDVYTPEFTLFEPDNRFTYIDKKAQYSFSQQAALWRTGAFRRNLRDGEDPWETELNGSGRIEHGPDDAFGDFLGVNKPALQYHNILNKGVFDPKATAWLLEQGTWSLQC